MQLADRDPLPERKLTR